MHSLDGVIAIVLGWLAVGLAGLVRPRSTALVAHLLFPVGALLAAALAVAAILALLDAPHAVIVPFGLPNLPMHLRLDSLSAFFLFLLGSAGFGISIFACGYFRAGEGSAPGVLCLEYHVFLAAMALVLIADDAYAFLVFWETMALASFFLVISNHRVPAIRDAGLLYLLIAHIGAVAILLCFAVLQANTGDYSFTSMRAQSLEPFWSSTAFLLAVIGFGAKAGLVPLHVWLPEAHPAAPSPVSALMSGVMLKTAIYGVLRVSFTLIDQPLWWWGVLLIGLGLMSALYGVIFSAVQTDMKRLLAWSSIENIGLLFAAIGLGLLFTAYDMRGPAALALTAALYHALSHAYFKSLLFLGTGAVLHATGERSLGRLGGLFRHMPWVAWLMLLGALAGSGLPPLSGFVAEWLLLQSFLFTTGLPDLFLDMLIPAVAALIALVAALAGYVMVKLFGVIFLGHAREPTLAQAHDASMLERCGLAWLALGCALLGLFPVQLIDLFDGVTRNLVGAGIGAAVHEHGWLVLAPTGTIRASYAPLVFLLAVFTCTLLTFVAVRLVYHGRLRRAAAWDCGFPSRAPGRNQDTAEGFGQPIREIFAPLLRLRRQLPKADDAAPVYRVKVEDHLWHWLYLPMLRFTQVVARVVGRLQHGRIAIYLLYSFVTLLVLLLVVT